MNQLESQDFIAVREKLWTSLWTPQGLFRTDSPDSSLLLTPTPLCKVDPTSTASREVIHSSLKV